MDNCKELFLDNIIAIDMYKASEVEFPIPSQVPNITSMAGVVLGERCLRVSVNGTGDAEIEEHPTVKVSQKRQTLGVMNTFDVSATVLNGIEALQEKIGALQGSDVIPVFRLENGKSLFGHTLYNTSTLTMTDKISKSRTGELSLSFKAMSGLIELL